MQLQSTLPQMQRLMRVMKSYMERPQTNNSGDIETINVQQLLDDFVDLMENHSINEGFEHIYNELGGFCDINQCTMLQRAYCDRSKTINYSSGNLAVIHQIMDKIHCFFSHSFDIGFKLNSKDKAILNAIPRIDNIDPSECIRNRRISKLHDILQSKHSVYRKISASNTRINNKYFLFSSESINNEKACANDDEKINENKIYSSGVKFKYENTRSHTYTDDISSSDDSDMDINDVIATYPSFKEEMIKNPFVILSIEQYDNEYKKAQYHFNTHYRKQNYTKLQLHHVLSLMVYCNYDALQHEFSKTYYLTPKKHCHFYHWGTSLSTCVNRFGTAIYPIKIKSFYHGITQPLVFAMYINHVAFDTSVLRILSPLSTSSSFEVATSFAQYGMVIDFGGTRTGVAAKYFSCAWISDFANEAEYLFIQNEYPLQMNNIYDVAVGTEYRIILNALKIIEAATTSSRSDIGHDILEEMWVVIDRIISNQLHVVHPQKYKAFKSLDDYGKIVWGERREE